MASMRKNWLMIGVYGTTDVSNKAKKQNVLVGSQTYDSITF